MCKRIMSSALGIGIAGAIIGLHIYCFMTPKNQRQIQKGMRKTMDELRDVAEELKEGVKCMG